MNKKTIIIPTLLLTSIFLLSGCGGKSPASTTRTNSTNQNTQATSQTGIAASFTLDEIKQHATKQDCWMAISGNVYDVTDFIKSGMHNPAIVQGCGIDATSLFDGVEKHSQPKAQDLLPQYFIGTLK